ncbi:stalk domain-containing protein, partial [Bacillus sp. JJ1503]
RFFTLNEGKVDSLVPLYFYDSRKVVVNGTANEGLEVIFEEGNSMFPFINTMIALDYEAEVLTDKETILLKKGSNTYRFFLNRNIFIYNEDDYGLLERPLAVINGNIYMSGQWIETLFKVTIEEEDDEIIFSY